MRQRKRLGKNIFHKIRKPFIIICGRGIMKRRNDDWINENTIYYYTAEDFANLEHYKKYRKKIEDDSCDERRGEE